MANTDSSIVDAVWASTEIRHKQLMSKQELSKRLDLFPIDSSDIDRCSERKISYIDYSKLKIKSYHIEVEQYPSLPASTRLSLESEKPNANGEKEIIGIYITLKKDCHAAISSLVSQLSYISLPIEHFRFLKNTKIGQLAIFNGNTPSYWTYHNLMIGVTSTMPPDDIERIKVIIAIDAYIKSEAK